MVSIVTHMMVGRMSSILNDVTWQYGAHIVVGHSLHCLLHEIPIKQYAFVCSSD